MGKLRGALMWLMLLGCALAVVYSSFANRKLAHEWQHLVNDHTQAQAQYGRLMLEYSTLAAPSRVEMLARQKLNMQFPDKNNTRIIQLNNR